MTGEGSRYINQSLQKMFFTITQLTILLLQASYTEKSAYHIKRSAKVKKGRKTSRHNRKHYDTVEDNEGVIYEPSVFRTVLKGNYFLTSTIFLFFCEIINFLIFAIRLKLGAVMSNSYSYSLRFFKCQFISN